MLEGELFQDDAAHVNRAPMLTEEFDEKKKNAK